MPNIKIHGLPRTESYHLAQKIFAVIGEGAPELKDQAVVTLCDDACIDCEGKSQPYLEIASTNPMETNTLVRILKPLGMDIETTVITSFHSKNKSPGKSDSYTETASSA